MRSFQGSLMFNSLFQSLGMHARSGVLLSPLAGRVIPLSEVHDQMFAKGLLGQGVAIAPSGERVVAPSDGKVEAIFPTGHAVALHTDEGLDVLIHVGLDTVKLEGRHFNVHASVGDTVKRGDVLIEFDRAAIMTEGYDVTAPIIICNSVEFASIKGRIGESVAELDPIITTKER